MRDPQQPLRLWTNGSRQPRPPLPASGAGIRLAPIEYPPGKPEGLRGGGSTLAALRLVIAIPAAGVLFVGGFLVACGTAERKEKPAQARVTVTENGTTFTGVVETLDSGDVVTKFDGETFTFTITGATTNP